MNWLIASRWLKLRRCLIRFNKTRSRQLNSLRTVFKHRKKSSRKDSVRDVKGVPEWEDKELAQ